jgi:hypothetical protein
MIMKVAKDLKNGGCRKRNFEIIKLLIKLAAL